MKVKNVSRSWFSAALAICFVLVFLTPSMADTEVSGLVTEVGYNKFILMETGSKTAVRYHTGRGTKYTPGEYRVVAGDLITVHFYEKPARNGGVMLAVTSVSLKKTDPKNTELKSPAIGIIEEVGRSMIRITYPKYKKTVSLAKKRGMKLIPAGYVPMVGDKVEVSFERYTNRWTQRSGNAISSLKKIE